MFELYILPILIFIGLGLLAGLLLSISSVFFAVEVDETVAQVLEALPGINCGACGYSGCEDYAKAVAAGAAPNQCVPGGPTVAEKVAAVMGTDAGEIVHMVAYVACNGIRAATKEKYHYQGDQTCLAVSKLYSGDNSCSFGCLGYGDCANVCPNNAICVIDGVAHISRDLCIGCGKCVAQCPKKIIHMKPLRQPVVVKCSSKQNGKFTRAACTNGCIGCKKCERSCEFDAIKVTDFLAQIDYSKCTACGKCIEECPTHCIH